MKAIAEAPSNIALIKYMGKVPGEERNLPANSSLSLTLPNLLSRVEIDVSVEPSDRWEPLQLPQWNHLSLSVTGLNKFLNHFIFLKNKWGIEGHFIVRSANNFPSDCGIASSASSFAALTLAAYRLSQLQNKKMDLNASELAALSRQGSGSSCRSFFNPYCEWNKNGEVSDFSEVSWDLKHFVVVTNKDAKLISSSAAHKKVETSLLIAGRFERAEIRLKELKQAFRDQDWKNAYQIIYEEFMDMHALFHTARPSFHYMQPESYFVLNLVEETWKKYNDGPWVTMDAGANVHLIYRSDQEEVIKTLNNQLNQFDLIQGR